MAEVIFALPLHLVKLVETMWRFLRFVKMVSLIWEFFCCLWKQTWNHMGENRPSQLSQNARTRCPQLGSCPVHRHSMCLKGSVFHWNEIHSPQIQSNMYEKLYWKPNCLWKKLVESFYFSQCFRFCEKAIHRYKKSPAHIIIWMCRHHKR